MLASLEEIFCAIDDFCKYFDNNRQIVNCNQLLTPCCNQQLTPRKLKSKTLEAISYLGFSMTNKGGNSYYNFCLQGVNSSLQSTIRQKKVKIEELIKSNQLNDKG